jgi:hypothetical protein
MINLKINGEKKTIPSIDELTVRQYSEFIKTDMTLVNYLSVVLGIPYKDAFNIKLKGMKQLKKRIGELKDYTKIPYRRKFLFRDRLIWTRRIDISTVGQRFMVEEHGKKLENEELLCFILALGIAKNPMNSEELDEIKDKLMDSNYKTILPIAFFLGSRFLIGRSNAMNYLRMLRLSIITRAYELKQGLKNLAHTLITLRFKRYASY